ncbi:MAG: LytTR family DNA-binding domain-containing protein [Oscillospiraceae bacterium]|nr:LytTR family DNA-binding domain-containing protein [Oscillospiraceae bacterium]
MLRIAIAEDEAICAQKLQEYIQRYAKVHGLETSVAWFSDGMDLVEKYTPTWDIIFLDIQMAHLDGMATARHIRRQDPDVTLVFITNLARYAIQGYEVDASDFILKPLEYDRFRVRMDKLTAQLTRKQGNFVVLPLAEQKIRVAVEDILYAEVADHDLHVVTTKQRYLMRGSLQEMERIVEGQGFSRCSRSYLVNLRRVSGVEKDAVRVGEHTLPISRPRKKQFLRELSDCLGAEL